ncbi:MAG: ABC transporter permease [Alphaproteobacteria bacterium]|nr:ABC transporter permease [Alphaproteobacteria bacterium]
MTRFLLGRVVQAAATLALLSFLVFALIGLMPGDPIDVMVAGDPRLTSEDAARLRALYGLDRPLVERYLAWAGGALSGDFGYSRLFARPAASALWPALLNTLRLLSVALALALCCGIALGILAARRARSRTDYAINLAAFAGISLPAFWLGLLLIILFAVTLGWLPAGGAPPPDQGGAAAMLRHMLLPVATLCVAHIAAYARYMRGAMLEVLEETYIRTARAKGCSTRRVLLAHALPNAAMPVITLAALDLGTLFSGALITETIFAWPGMGKLIYEAIMGNDYNLALLALLLAAAVTLAANILADIAQALLDPRVRLGEAAEP